MHHRVASAQLESFTLDLVAVMPPRSDYQPIAAQVYAHVQGLQSELLTAATISKASGLRQLAGG